MFYNIINTASASKVCKFRPLLGEVKKNKRSADEYLSVIYILHFVRDHSACSMQQMRQSKSGPCR